MGDQNTNNNENTSTSNQPATNINPNPKDKTEGKVTTHEPHKYFIPGIIILVVSIIVVETYYKRKPTNRIAELTPTEQAELQTLSGNTVSAAVNSDATDEVDIAQVSGTTDMTETIATDNNVTQQKPAESSTETAATNTKIIAADNKPVKSEQQEVFASREPVTDSAPRAYPAYPPLPFEPPMPYGLSPQQQQHYLDMMERRRNAEARAMESLRRHREQMHQYRMAVLKRVEQDYRDMKRHMEELRARRDRAHAETMRQLEAARNRTTNPPI